MHDTEADELRMYYGAADCAVALATARMSEVLEYAVSCPAGEPERPW